MTVRVEGLRGSETEVNVPKNSTPPLNTSPKNIFQKFLEDPGPNMNKLQELGVRDSSYHYTPFSKRCAVHLC